MNAINPVYREAYDKLLGDLDAIVIKQDKLRAEYDKLKTALEGLKPLIGENKIAEPQKTISIQSSKINGGPIRWKNDCLDFLIQNTGSWFTSPEIFEKIYPGATSLTKEERRKKMVYVSVALKDLVIEERIISEVYNGRGFKYSLNENAKASLFGEAS